MSETESTPLKGVGPNYPILLCIVALTMAIGTGLAKASLVVLDPNNQELHDSKIQTVKDGDLQYLYLALVVVGKTITFLNFVPTSYKNGMKGNIRSNPFFYQIVGDDKSTVVFQEHGPIGMYNRSNRSIQHMIENAGGFFAALGPVGWLFPKQALCIATIFCAGRMIHQKGYSSGYGSHALGFLLSALSVFTLEGLALIAFLKGEEIIA